jgi:Flp pilus assembly protein TadD
METGQLEAGLDHLRKGAHLAPNYPPVYEHLGLAYAKQGRHREAIGAFERATKLQPNYQHAWQHLADEYRLAGRPRDAQQAALRAESLERHSPNGHKKQS